MHLVVKPQQNEPLCKIFLEQSKCIFNPVYVVDRESLRKSSVVWKYKSNCWSEGCAESELKGFGWCIDGVNYIEECTTCTALYWPWLVCRRKRQSRWVLFSVSSGLTYQPTYCKHFISSSCQKRLCVARCLGQPAFCLSPASSCLKFMFCFCFGFFLAFLVYNLPSLF